MQAAAACQCYQQQPNNPKSAPPFTFNAATAKFTSYITAVVQFRLRKNATTGLSPRGAVQPFAFVTTTAPPNGSQISNTSQLSACSSPGDNF